MPRAGQRGGDTPSRRAELADAIATIVLAEGVGALGLRGIAARVGTSDRMLIYYFQTKDQLVTEVLERVSARLALILVRFGQAPPLSPGQFLAQVLQMTRDPEIAPFMTLWTDVIARAARRESPYDRVAPGVVASWLGWIESRLHPHEAKGRAAAILSIVEGVMLLETAVPGSTAGVQPFLAGVLEG